MSQTGMGEKRVGASEQVYACALWSQIRVRWWTLCVGTLALPLSMFFATTAALIDVYIALVVAVDISTRGEACLIFPGVHLQLVEALCHRVHQPLPTTPPPVL